MTNVTLINNSTQKALTTLGRAKIFLGISSDSKDQLITMLINQTTGFIERYCRRSFLKQTYTNEVYDGSGSKCLILKNYPVASVSSLQENLSDDSTGDWSTINSDYYFVQDHGIIEAFNFTFARRPRKYRITYLAGYLIDFDNENTVASHTLPQEIEYACLKLVSALLNTRQAEGLSQSRMGDLGVSFKATVMNDEETKAILDKYTAPIA